MACKLPINTISCSASSSLTKLSPSVSVPYRFSPSKRHVATTLSPSPGCAIVACTRGQESVDSALLDSKRSQKKQNLSFKDVFERKSLWRRIFFASKKVRSIILLNVITVVYASNIPVVKEVEAITDPATFTVVRFAVSAIPFIPSVLKARGDVHTRNSGMELGFWVSLGYLMQALGLLTSDAGRASFISMLTIIVVPLLDGMLGAVVPARTWFGALMSIVGVGMLESSGSSPTIGDLLNFLSAVFFGIHMLRTEHISRNTKRMNLLPLLAYEVCVLAIFSTLWYLISGYLDGNQASDPSSWTWAMIWHWIITFPWIPALYTGVFSTALCLWIENPAKQPGERGNGSRTGSRTRAGTGRNGNEESQETLTAVYPETAIGQGIQAMLTQVNQSLTVLLTQQQNTANQEILALLVTQAQDQARPQPQP